MLAPYSLNLPVLFLLQMLKKGTVVDTSRVYSVLLFPSALYEKPSADAFLKLERLGIHPRTGRKGHLELIPGEG